MATLQHRRIFRAGALYPDDTGTREDHNRGMTSSTRAIRLISATALLAGMAACTPREEAPLYGNAPSVSIRTPQERSYLDPGPQSPQGSAPNYMRDNRTSTTLQTDSFGNDILRQSR